MSITHFPRFSVSSPYSRSCSVWVSFSTFICFRSKFQVLQYAFLIFHEFCCFSPYSKSYSVHFSFYSFSSFLPYSSSFTFCVSFSTFFSFFCLFVFCFLCFFFHYPGPTVCISHFSTYLSFLAISQLLKCEFHIFHILQCFSPYSIAYSMCISFSTFFSFLAIF